MAYRPIRVVPAAALQEGFETIRREAGVPAAFPAEVEAEARSNGARGTAERVDIPFVTIDPPGSRDLDQAVHIERRGDGHRVRYAIADVGAFVIPGRALDAESHARGVTVYAPDVKTRCTRSRCRRAWRACSPGSGPPRSCGRSTSTAPGTSSAPTWLAPRSAASPSTPTPTSPHRSASCSRRSGSAASRWRSRAAACSSRSPEQEVVREGGSWTVRYRVPLATEDHNAQISLLTGMAAAQLMLASGTGILRTQPRPDERSLERLRHQARALGAAWPRSMSYPDFVRSLDPARPAHAALMHEAAGVGRGAGYTAFDGEPPEETEHFAIAGTYAHATAPLRRLQDRYVSECCLAASAGTPIPDWVHAGLAALPDAMTAAGRRAGTVERGVVDLVEAALLSGREGEVFPGVVVDEKLVQLAEPAVRGKLVGHAPEPGNDVEVRLTSADMTTRRVTFEAAAS